MPREINGQRYYETSEVCQKAGISRPTLFRWLKRGVLDRLHRDRRGWRLFTKDDLRKIQAEANKVEAEDVSLRGRKC
jgi:DNA-binding transcriptional MerR regulator